jgi:hypothetical protein
MANLGSDHIDLTIRFHDQDPCLTVAVGRCPEGVRTSFDLRDGQSAPGEGRPSVIVRTGCDPIERATGVWLSDRGTLRLEPVDGVTRVFIGAEMGDGGNQGEFHIDVETEIDPDETVPWHPEVAFLGAPEGEPL